MGTTSGVPAGQVVDRWRSYGATGLRLGHEDAQVSIVVFSDYECPYCARLWNTIDTLMTQLDVPIDLVYRHSFPDHRRYARYGALAAECAAIQQRFLEFHSLLFSSQESIGERSWRRFAANAGVPDLEAFDECLDSDRQAWRLAEDRRAATVLGVRGTPTFLVENRMWVGAVSVRQMLCIIELQQQEETGSEY